MSCASSVPTTPLPTRHYSHQMNEPWYKNKTACTNPLEFAQALHASRCAHKKIMADANAVCTIVLKLFPTHCHFGPGVSRIVPLLQNELRNAEARLGSCNTEMLNLSEENLQKSANEGC